MSAPFPQNKWKQKHSPDERATAVTAVGTIARINVARASDCGDSRRASCGLPPCRWLVELAADPPTNRSSSVLGTLSKSNEILLVEEVSELYQDSHVTRPATRTHITEKETPT